MKLKVRKDEIWEKQLHSMTCMDYKSWKSGNILDEIPQFYMFPRSHGNSFFCTNRGRSQEIKRELVYVKGGSHTHVFSWDFWNTLGGLMPSSCYRNLANNVCFFVGISNDHDELNGWGGWEGRGPEQNVECLFNVSVLTLSTCTCATWRFNYYSWKHRTWDCSWQELGSLFCIVFGSIVYKCNVISVRLTIQLNLCIKVYPFSWVVTSVCVCVCVFFWPCLVRQRCCVENHYRV